MAKKEQVVSQNRLENVTKITREEHFGIQRKMVAHMTTRSWNEIPHISTVYEPDVTEFYKVFRAMQQERAASGRPKISFNTMMLRLIVEGLKAAPIMNSTLEFNSHKVTGLLSQREDIDVSVPWTLPNGEMMTITLPDIHNDTLDDICEKTVKIANKLKQTNLTEAMYEISFEESLSEIKKLHLGVFRRIIAAKTGKHKIELLKGQARKKYYTIPADDRLTLKDLRQGTITVSNIGSIHRDFRGHMALLEIIPPQIVAIGICNIQERPGVYKDENGVKQIGIRKVLPLCIAGDHRAVDYGDIVPFIKRLDEIFAKPEIILGW